MWYFAALYQEILPEILPDEEVHVVQIDFTDFRQVPGDKEALAAFDVGWAVLHEIDHVISDSADPITQDVAGDCEGHINQMRRELGLPVRSNYFFAYVRSKTTAILSVDLFVSVLIRKLVRRQRKGVTG